jgi:cellulose synthase/poly-beta-1,6-N-acetylglucosamine synthase-like glycosyltransferase/peptidoglycan/xylan/chitin deacetylase (PgdA/CDA1 family)/spore germination protein YaaH
MSKQIFESHSSTRWKRFIWVVRIALVLIVIGIASILFSFFRDKKYSSKDLFFGATRIQNINVDTAKEKISEKELLSFAKHLDNVRKQKKKDFYKKKAVLPSRVKDYLPVRAGFYVNWDKSSATSLKENIGKLNMVLPEWLFQTDSKGNMEVQIDEGIIDLLRAGKVAIVPLITNNYGDRWNSDSTYLMLKNKESRTKLIGNIKSTLDKYHFQGINVDFESLPARAYPFLYEFSKELNAALNPSGYLTSIDTDPFDKNIDITKIAGFYDLIFLMAYDEHSPESGPGGIASIDFVEKSLDNAMKKLPSEKFVLCLATYGYKWTKGLKTDDLTYEEFIALANSYEVPVNYSTKDEDLYISYVDKNGLACEAHCNDAVSVYNSMLTAADYGTAGVAMWYLGSEDYRLWNFYGRDLSVDSLTKTPINFDLLRKIKPMYSIDYDGNGELMEVISQPENGMASIEVDSTDFFISDEKYDKLPSSYLIKRYGSTDKKKIAITFDDGPDEDYTPDILDILKQKNVHATFFVTGLNIENNITLLKRVYKEGHEIGNHTFTHPNLENTSDERERIELRSTRLLLESVLGHTTLLFRPPYNTDAEPQNMIQMRPLMIANDEGYITVASSIDPNDWQEGVIADTIVARAIAQHADGNIMLMHDAGGERSQTVIALPRIIDYFRQQGYGFVTVSELMGKTRDQVMPPMVGNIRLAEKVDNFFFFTTFIWQHFLKGFFFIAIILGIIRLVSLLAMVMLQRQKEKRAKLIKADISFSPRVSVIVPGYNEELNAVRTIENLLKSDYKNLEVLFVDDGSKDNTYEVVKTAFGNHPKVRVLTKPNGGKASALNFAIGQTTSEILVCVDADTILLPDAIPKMIPFFTDENVGAVAGNVRVGNPVNLLTNWQKIEYTTSQNFDRNAFDYVNAILVVPGAIGAFRKTVMDEVGGFSTDTLAEDCDITVRILRAGYTVRTCNEAISLTEAPESMGMFLKQRFRWSFGMMQSFWKHRDLLFNTKKPNMGWVLLPNLLIFGFIIPVFAPVVDILFVFGLFSKHANVYIWSYVAFFAVDWLISTIAYRFDHQKFGLFQAVMLFIQRFVYRQLLFYVLIKAYLKAIKGELAHWGVLKRTGNVKE